MSVIKKQASEFKKQFFDTDEEEQDEGKKDDKDKLLVSLMLKGFILPLIELSRVVTFGASKYGKMNWQKVSKERYEEALGRHYFAWLNGNRIDQETGLHHLAHLAFNVLAVLYWEIKEK